MAADKLKRVPELLAPAGDFEKLKAAVHFGADAVYIGGARFGLRKASKNFENQDLEQAVAFAHEHGVRVHVTLNIVPHDRDLIGLDEYLEFLDRTGVDAVIISDPGIFMRTREKTNLEIHLSTQASITNSDTIRFWANLGARRIVLARELSLEEIREIRRRIPEDVELETFVHGAMCISYSGRCLLSNYMTGRDANQGDCAQACRWKYHLVEENRPGEYFPIEEAEGGTFLMNSKDLCLLPHLGALTEAGINSFKIEGRVKTQYYVSTVIHAYREALDTLAAGRLDADRVQSLLDEIKKTSHRSFTTGFFFGNPGREGQNYRSSAYIQSYDFVGVVKGYDEKSGLALVEERNKFALGDSLEIFGRKPGFLSLTVGKIYDSEGAELSEANVPRKLFRIPVAEPVEVGDILRKPREA